MAFLPRRRLRPASTSVPLVLSAAAALTLASGREPMFIFGGGSLPFEARPFPDEDAAMGKVGTARTETTTTPVRTTFTTSTSSTSTSTTGPHVFGGNVTKEAFAGWLSIWRSKYEIGLWNAGLPDPWESMLPEALRGHKCKVVRSKGGAAGGVVTEGMGYGIMIEGILAARGEDPRALNNSLSLIKSWFAMVNGGVAEGTIEQPFAGGENRSASSTRVETWPYGVSAVEWSHRKLGPAGVPAWKFPINETNIKRHMGSATDGDQDAMLGMIYTAHALRYPADFVDMTVRSVIAFASADLGFPDLYRVLPNGDKVFVPKLGSMWGGLLPESGSYKTKQQPWCYSPGYFAPAHYRTMRDFVLWHWRPEFDDYLPAHQNRKPSTLHELIEAFASAIDAGYNILYYSSCASGSVSNWVGVKAACADPEQLNCPGVPWEHTPWVGPTGGTCAQSGTTFGAFGADASRSAWRVAMDYALYREQSHHVKMYDRQGNVDEGLRFGAQRFLNRIVGQYSTRSICDGGIPGDCFRNTTSPFRLAYAFDVKKFNATDVMCPNVPNQPMSWWAGFMAYPTFAAFVAPYDEISAEQMTNWMDTFASICNFSAVDKWEYSRGGKPRGAICLDTYFEASQAVIATMVMSDNLRQIFPPHANWVSVLSDAEAQDGAEVIPDEQQESGHFVAHSWRAAGMGAMVVAVVLGLVAGATRWRARGRTSYAHLRCGPQSRSVVRPGGAAHFAARQLHDEGF